MDSYFSQTAYILARTFFLALIALLLFCPVGIASSTRPNSQEIRAQHELDLIKMQKQQQVANFKKQRDELLISYKELVGAKDEIFQLMKISERDYKTALAKFKSTQEELSQIEKQMTLLRKNDAKVDKSILYEQMQKIQDRQAKLMKQMQTFSSIQQDSYARMISADSQYRNFAAKEQILKQQVESVQRQLQFVLSQP